MVKCTSLSIGKSASEFYQGIDHVGIPKKSLVEPGDVDGAVRFRTAKRSASLMLHMAGMVIPVLESASKVEIIAVIEIAIAQELSQGMKRMFINVVSYDIVHVIRVEGLPRVRTGIRSVCMVIVRSIQAVCTEISLQTPSGTVSIHKTQRQKSSAQFPEALQWPLPPSP